MAHLFMSPADMKETTILGGNLDFDNFAYIMEDVQNTVILPLLGQELYDVISAGAEGNSLAGEYLELYNNFVKPITKYQTVAEYVIRGGFMITNGGNFLHTPENGQLMSEAQIERLYNTYTGMAETYMLRFEEWICLNHLTEYKTTQDGVDAEKNMQSQSGWYFGLPSNRVIESYANVNPMADYLDNDKLIR